MASITTSNQWMRLRELREQWRGRRVADLLAADPARASHLKAEAAGIQLDYSRQCVDAEVLDALFDLLKSRDLPAAIQAMYRGDAINHTEHRAALHVALRAKPGDDVANEKILAQVQHERTRMLALAEAVRSGAWQAPSGGVFRDIVHIGIGGSHLGPALALDALDENPEKFPHVHFLSSNDPRMLQRLLKRLDPAATLIVLVSKSFTTAETKLNAERMRDWLAEHSNQQSVLENQFVGISANPAGMSAFGIPENHQLTFADWVGGRYSLWSAVGFPVAVRCGVDIFMQMLEGAREMDRHFRSANPRENLAVLLALLGIWNINFLNVDQHAVLPYSEALALFPDYLQQLEMESNGKRIDRDGNEVDYQTAPVIFGGVGMNGQHAFYQQLHQGTGWTPLDFIVVNENIQGFEKERNFVLANALAQAEALTQGRSEKDLRQELEQKGELELLKYKLFPGNRPSSLIVLDRLDAHSLGALLAMYEHKVFVQSVIWNLNPFDQFGVEFGKQLAGSIAAALEGDELPAQHDAATQRLVKKLRKS